MQTSQVNNSTIRGIMNPDSLEYRFKRTQTYMGIFQVH